MGCPSSLTSLFASRDRRCRIFSGVEVPFPSLSVLNEDSFCSSGHASEGHVLNSWALALAGAAPPQTLMWLAPDNPEGFWESDVVAALNDRILASHASSCDVPLRISLT